MPCINIALFCIDTILPDKKNKVGFSNISLKYHASSLVGLEEFKRKFGWARADFAGFLVNSHSIDQKNGGICTGQADLQPISFTSDRLLV